MQTFELFREKIEANERGFYHPKAAFSIDHSRYDAGDCDHRLPYRRDVDRIVHSKAYSRYTDKTQVVYLLDKSDHICHRGLHVQLVSQFARGISQILRLNGDLVEAIALGHDVGHPPFGHEGEGYLSAIAEKYIGRPFTHSWQSCRLFTLIEPLNLGLNVLDGFLCHDGGIQEPKLAPCFGKSWSDHKKELQQRVEDPDCFLVPATLEGCLVKLCDTMSYIGRDLEDAISLKIIERYQIPLTHLGNSNREILGNLARDIIAQSYEQDYIALSEESFKALNLLRKFNFERIYSHPGLKVESNKIARSYHALMSSLLEEARLNLHKSRLWNYFLHSKSDEYRQESSLEEQTIDFIAGMTDHYFINLIEELFLPKKITL